MSRKNHRSRKTQARRRSGEPIKGRPPVAAAPKPLNPVIIPTGRCFFGNRSGKMTFTKEQAERAIKQAAAERAKKKSGHCEKRYYPCPQGGCGGYHLTSWETFKGEKVS